MNSNQGSNLQLPGLERTILSTPVANVANSPSARRRRLQMDDSMTQSPPKSPRIRVKRIALNNIFGHKDQDLGQDKREIHIEHKASPCNLDTVKNNGPLSEANNKHVQTSSSDFSNKVVKISEKIENRNLNLSIPTNLPEESSMSSALQAERTVRDYKNLNNMTFSSDKHMQALTVNCVASRPQDYWAISKLAGLFRRPSIEQTVLHTEHVVDQIKKSKIHSDICETNSTDNTSDKEANDSQIQTLNNTQDKKSNSEKESLVSKFSKWLTTSDVKHTGSDSEDEESSIKQAGRHVYQWTTTKKVDISNKDINMMSPSSL